MCTMYMGKTVYLIDLQCIFFLLKRFVIIFRLQNKKQQRKSIGDVIHYNILTKPSLFRNYLRSSEIVEVKFSTGISNIEIGKANIPIPVELIEFIDQQTFQVKHQSKKLRKRCYIFNAQSKIMGELMVEYELALYDRVFSESEVESDILINLKNDEIENDKNHFNIDFDLAARSSTKISHKKKFKSPKKRINAEKIFEKIPTSSTNRLTSKATCASPLLNYLTGRPLAEIEKNEAVKAMQSTSPTESLIDLLSYDLNGLYLPNKKNNDAELKVLKKIDCLRIQVYDLCLTRAGTREILSKNASNESSFSSGTFTVDVELDSILSTKSPFEKNNVFTSQVTRIFGSSIETLPPSKLN